MRGTKHDSEESNEQVSWIDAVRLSLLIIGVLDDPASTIEHGGKDKILCKLSDSKGHTCLDDEAFGYLVSWS